jgi:uncharacterized membrane protein (DUF485 family)
VWGSAAFQVKLRQLCDATALIPTGSITILFTLGRGIPLRRAQAARCAVSRALIRIKVIVGGIALTAHEYTGVQMPRQTAIIVAGIVLAFAAFAISLAWADFYTRNFRPTGAAD